MSWDEIRALYPEKWVVVEALVARTEGDRRVIDSLVVTFVGNDGQAAWRAYAELHGREPERELLVLHTARETLDITVKRWCGLRGGNLSLMLKNKTFN